MKKLIKAICRFIGKIILFFDKILITPLMKLFMKITDFFKNNTKGLEKYLTSKKALLIISLLIAFLAFYKLDKDLIIKVIWPDLDNIIYDNSINNMSMVFKLFCKGKSILFTGDIEEEGERKILSSLKAVSILKSDIIKVAHHGSKSSSIIDFIQAVSPEIALIGVGQNNKFGHPNNDVLIRYKKIGSKIFRTDLQGQITFSY